MYPSAGVTNTRVTESDQDILVKLYETYGLKQLKLCTFYEGKKSFDYNPFDFKNGKNAPNHLMFGAIDELNLENNYSQIQVNYREKYLKYKAKYLNLKKWLKNKKY